MPLHLKEILAIKSRLDQPLSWVASFFLPRDSLGVGERMFGEVVTQLHRLTGPIYQHTISTFNTCSRGPTHRSLTDTGRGYNLRDVDFTHITPLPSHPMVSAFYLSAPSGLQFNQALPTKPKLSLRNL
jgi:hypothetical protein